MKRPSFQFYPADWRKDPALAVCSRSARGLWIDLLCLMHESGQYGYLVINDRPMTREQIVRAVGGDQDTYAELDELVNAGVCSVDERGALFSRRMVRDEAAREERARVGRENGKKGAKFGVRGAEHGAKGGRPRAGSATECGAENPGNEPPQKPPQKPLPSSSSSSSTSVGEETPSSLRSEAPLPEPADPEPDPVIADLVALSEQTAAQVIDAVRGPKKRRQLHELPDGFPTDDLIATAVTEHPWMQGRCVAESFRDHHLARGSTMRSWPAAWRTWVRNEARWHGPGARGYRAAPSGRPMSRIEAAQALHDRLDADERVAAELAARTIDVTPQQPRLAGNGGGL